MSIARVIFDLDEPWRTRFVEYVALRLNKDGHRLASASELAAWLAEDPGLACTVAGMVRGWSPEARR